MDRRPCENDFIFMKLNRTKDIYGNVLNGVETMEAFVQDCEKNGKTWFRMKYMSEQWLKHYQNLLREGKSIWILFGIGQAAGGENDIAYSAVIEEILLSDVPVAPPGNRPNAFGNSKGTVWLKLSDVRIEHELRAAFLQFQSTGRNLKEVMEHSRCHFGYVRLQ